MSYRKRIAAMAVTLTLLMPAMLVGCGPKQGSSTDGPKPAPGQLPPGYQPPVHKPGQEPVHHSAP